MGGTFGPLMAEYVLMYILAKERSLIDMWQEQQNSHWNRYKLYVEHLLYMDCLTLVNAKHFNPCKCQTHHVCLLVFDFFQYDTVYTGSFADIHVILGTLRILKAETFTY